MIKILVADDHAVVRAGLKQYVSDTTDMVVADEAASGEEALNKVLKGNFDVVLLDITMPGINGLDVLKQVKSQKPEVKVLILTIYPEEQYAMRALKAGASGYLTKESAPQELILAIRKVASGGKYISSSFAERLAFDLTGNVVKPLHQTLSDREYQIMCMIAMGKRLNEIAKDLSLSVKTVSSYRSRLLKKLNLKSNTDIVRYTLDNQLSL
jgi:two-component system, NarL family, invasion response regulator UvrY